jgi:two-component system nitrogen regulation sensor histidine kinase NtrY
MAKRTRLSKKARLEFLELKKRKREAVVILLVGLLFCFLMWVEFQLVNTSEKLPFVHSIFFFGLVNFNIVLFLFLIFLIFRNIVKIFVERQGKIIGSSLKGKLVAAFVAFSSVPTLLMFIVSVFYINSSFDKWFSVKMAGVLKDSLEVTNAYYLSEKKRNYHYADLIGDAIIRRQGWRVKPILERMQVRFQLDAVEYYPDLFSDPEIAKAKDEAIPDLPKVSLEFLQKGITERVNSSTIHYFGQGNLIRVVVPVHFTVPTGEERAGAVVVSTFVPLSLISKMDEIASAYDEMRGVNPLEYPLKSIYLIILFLMTLTILLGATWFGFYLARQLSTPLAYLGEAAQKVSKGEYKPVQITTGSKEINRLVASFNQMTRALDASDKEVKEVNQDLKATLDILDEYSRYIEVVLSHVSAGVISVDSQGVLTTINRRAGNLLKIDPKEYVGKPYKEVLPKEYYAMISGLLETLNKHRAKSIQKEMRFNIGGDNLLMRMTFTILRDEAKRELGMVVVFDDMTELVSAQRAAAWREVARRIAHEIKNPLTPIKLSAQRLQKKFGQGIEDPAFKDCTTTIISQVDQLKNLVNEFSNFARLPKVVPRPSSLKEILDEIVVLYRSGHKDLTINVNYDAALPVFEFDPDQMKRVFVNLLENAVAATEEEGERLVSIDASFDSVLNIVRVSCNDNGAGIPDEIRGRVFEPYFSTKSQGTGLGLTIVKKIVEDHNGFVRAVAGEPKGTKMVVELPVVVGAGGHKVLLPQNEKESV